MHIEDWVQVLPIKQTDKEELQDALNRRVSDYWMERRQIWHKLCSERLEEKSNRAYRKLINSEKISPIHYIDDSFTDVVQDLRALGYSCAAISNASHHAISASWVSAHTEIPTRKVRGQVIELLEDLSQFNVRKWQLKKSYETGHGPKLEEKEKQKIAELHKLGYSSYEVAELIHRCPSTVRRQVLRNESRYG